ncbi:oxidoreductase [Flammeovirga aprica]|uniref:SDR family NAD(P)-dependent oxidoreductase n=1 Tax=Flammeovirga aprica JL-4 TaxID=694437 RepID=A0A7X9P3M0_9BACT|nr:oxidoreductase [Flammeovirga aprica]NME68084.1 SDR family NAD(P)-dependent oxidoreductase [Flammeovirga aprica JL-4]
MNIQDIKNFPSQKGRIAIVTGANIGLGLETSRFFALKEMKVILACRNMQKAESAMQDIRKTVPNADLLAMPLDLSDLESVRSFAQSYTEKFDSLDLLINNAGIMVPPFSKTKDGFESQMGVNYFAHFLLTGLLLPLLEKTEGSRIVALGSMAHKSGKIDFDNLNAEKSYSKFGAYSMSKLSCIMFAYELQRRLNAHNYQVKAVAAHPGGSMTNLMQHIPSFMVFLMENLFSGMFNTAQMGALPTVYAALGEDIKGGDYTGPDGFREVKGKNAIKVPSTDYSHREDLSKLLWDESERLTHFNYSF